MTSYKHLFQRALAAAPERLHLAAHSHHLWPDASYVGQLAYWEDSARHADRKWHRVMDEVWPAAQLHVARELRLPDPSTIAFAGNTHDFLLRIISAHPRRPLRILASDGEFHSFRRQVARWIEDGIVTLETIPVGGPDFAGRLLARAGEGAHDLIFVSHVMFGSGAVFDRIDALGGLARPDGPWVVVDGYHGFMAMPTDLSASAGGIFYLAGGYKYAMAGEGVAILHAPPGFAPRPRITGWYADLADLESPDGRIAYAGDARRFLGATFDPSGLYRFVAVRDMLAGEGLDTAAIAGHAAALRDRLLGRIGETVLRSATLLNPPGAGPGARFLALASPRAAAWKAALDEDDVIVDVRGDVLRIGIGLYNDARDIDRFVEVASRLS